MSAVLTTNFPFGGGVRSHLAEQEVTIDWSRFSQVLAVGSVPLGKCSTFQSTPWSDNSNLF